MIGKRRRPSGLSSSDIASVTLATGSGTKRSADNNTKHVDEAKQSNKKKITAATNDKEEHEEDNKKLDDDSKNGCLGCFLMSQHPLILFIGATCQNL
ncbi:hypothetical protein P8452_53600 [Trifolium repens]|nr:hypothetical protein P8452_53600 [Trifolium repens]